MFRKEKYELHGTFGLFSNTTKTFSAVLDTGARLNLVQSKVLPLGWETMIKYSKSPKGRGTSRRPIEIRRVLPLYLQLGHLNVRPGFFIYPKLEAEGILGTSIIDRFVKVTYPGKKRVAFHQGAPLPVVSSCPRPLAAPTKAKYPTRTVSNKVKLAKAIATPPMTQVLVQWVLYTLLKMGSYGIILTE